MCTLSLFREDNGYLVVMNRDESHWRTPEQSPQMLDADRGVLGPLDPDSGGTWIACNRQGYWGCLLNGYFENEVPSPPDSPSRGGILPAVLGAENPLARARDLHAARYASFRLLVGSPSRHVLYVWDGRDYREHGFHAAHEDRAFMLTSSGLRQDEVIEARRRLFLEWVAENTPDIADVPAFHRSRAPTIESAPLMLRDYSGTKSITAVRVGQHDVTMAYWPVRQGLPPDERFSIGRSQVSRLAKDESVA